jgi:hypothetical protein
MAARTNPALGGAALAAHIGDTDRAAIAGCGGGVVVAGRKREAAIAAGGGLTKR